MVDIHCHVLPCVDDGAASWEIACDMCRIAARDGIEHIVATPHANHKYFHERSLLLELTNHLQASIGEVPKISLGCDFHLSFENVEKVIEDPDRFVISNTRYLLVELSDFAVSPSIGVTLHQLMRVGLFPIITHPERNPILQHRPEWLIPWIEAGSLVQVTASAVTGRWGAVAERTAKWLLKRNAVHILATDAHDTKLRPPILSEARWVAGRWMGEDVAEALVSDNPRAIVLGQILPYVPQVSPTC
jgi:protein-tyrosine phosphatase